MESNQIKKILKKQGINLNNKGINAVKNLLSENSSKTLEALKPIEIEDITNLDNSKLENLKIGNKVIKSDSTGEHLYTVTFRCNSGLCLTYTDCDNIETVAYIKNGDNWSYDDTTITHISNG